MKSVAELVNANLTVDEMAAAFAEIERHPLPPTWMYVHGPDFGLEPGCWLLRPGQEPVQANTPEVWL